MAQSEVVVCTRNRPSDMERLLLNLASLSSVPPVLVIDSSDDQRTRQLVETTGQNPALRIRYAHTAAGLTLQRMEGVRRLAPETEVVHFVDDDVVLEPEYFSAMEGIFDENLGVLGVGGLITNLPAHRVNLTRQLFCLDSRAGGRVLRSGVNVLVFAADEPRTVDWLSGCSMSYRRSVFERLSFDLQMTGYSLGEDVDFSYRVGRVGRLVVTPNARLTHLCSPVERAASGERAREAIVRRYHFVRQMRGDLKLTAFWWSVVGELVILVSKGVLRARRSSLIAAGNVALAAKDIFAAHRSGPEWT